MGSRSVTTGSIASSIRTVQFGATEVRKSVISTISQEQEGIDEELEEKDSPQTQHEVSITSWNERMRHQASPLVSRVSSSLDPVICTVFVVILLRCSEALAIIRETHGIPYLDINVDYIPISDRYKNNEYYELDNIVNNDFWTLTYTKFRRDICWVEKVLKITIDNLQRSWYFQNFSKVLNDYNLMREDEETLLMSKRFNQQELQRLRVCEESEREVLMKNLQELTEELGNLKDELNDGITEYAIKMRFLKQWENARYEQNKMVLKNKENSYIETTKMMAIQLERENRVHEEMESYIQESLEDYQQQIEQWMEKYDDHLEDYEIKIGKLKMDVETQKERHAALMEKYNYHSHLIQEYKEYKLQKQKEAEEEERRKQAATKIQSWWRGIMFRKGLGPFRRKKGKGKRGGSGKDSGKKNKK